MNVEGRAQRTIWPAAGGMAVEVIDQTKLPHRFEVLTLRTRDDAARAISTMVVRGAPLIGASGAYGLALAALEDPSDPALERAHAQLHDTRPTAVDLAWGLRRTHAVMLKHPPGERAEAAFAEAARICEESVAACSAIGDHGRELIAAAHAAAGGGRPVNVLTHCNAGWLATVDWGTALAPVYKAHRAGLPVHVWVDETRPRNQGALTLWELMSEGVPCTLVTDNAGGHLMQHGMVDLCIVGSDRTTARGDAANKVGTYLKALAAHDNGVPFHVALPGSTIDWRMQDGRAEIPIEQRAAEEITEASGPTPDGGRATVRLHPEGCAVANYGFDVTPARLVTSLITERGTCPASASGLAALFPEHAAASAA
jgi:methylthioribose-1-phosphate isomerase